MICDAFFPNSAKTPLNPLDYFAFSYLTISVTSQVTKIADSGNNI